MRVNVAPTPGALGRRASARICIQIRPRLPAALLVPTTLAARGRRRREPRGAVLPFVCILLTVLIGSAALAVDMGRLYLIAAEVQSEADAAALAAASASQLTPNNDSQNGPARAQQYAARNRAAGQAGNVATGDVVPLLYDPATRTSTVSSYYGTVNAVQVTARARPTYVFAGALHLTPPTVSRTGTAWIANVNGAACVRPVAPSFTRMYEVAKGLTTRPYSSQNTYAPDFTQQEVVAFSPAAGASAVSRTFVFLPPWSSESYWDQQGQPITGMWHTVNYGQGNSDWPAFTQSMGASAGSASCARSTAQVGSYLTPYTWQHGDSANLTKNFITPGFVQLCNQLGNNGLYDATCRNPDGTVGVVARLPFPDSIPDKHATFTQNVRMVTQVRIMCYFQSAQATCPAAQIKNGAGQTIPWQMPSNQPGGPPVSSGYTPSTVVVMLEGPMFVDLGSDVVLGNTVSLSQRLVLVK